MGKRFFVILLAMFISSLLCGKAQEPRTKANHSVSINILGLEYAYEHPIGKKFTIIGRSELTSGLAWNSGNMGDIKYSHFGWLLLPSVGSEARYYYNLKQRFAKGRNISNNSGSFFSMRMHYYFPYGISSENVEIAGGIIKLTPGWGFRRFWQNKWLFEFRTGINFAFERGDISINPALNVSFGYAF